MPVGGMPHYDNDPVNFPMPPSAPKGNPGPSRPATPAPASPPPGSVKRPR